MLISESRGEDADAFLDGLHDRMADKRIIQRDNTDNVDRLAQTGDRGGHIVDGVNIIMQESGGLRRAMPRQRRLLQRLRQLMVKRGVTAVAE